jgi:hypothetical protein
MVRTEHNPSNEKLGRVAKVFPIQRIGSGPYAARNLGFRIAIAGLRVSAGKRTVTPYEDG